MTPPTESPSSSSPRSPSAHPPFPKRKADATNTGTSNRPVKRRASNACQYCRARKVRCNVVAHGAPCTNCRLDELPCIVTERRRNPSTTAEDSASGRPAPHAHMYHHQHSFSVAEALTNGSVNPVDISHGNLISESHSVNSVFQDDEMENYHMLPNLYHNQMNSYDDNVPRVNNFSLHSPSFQNLNSVFAADLAPASFEPAPRCPPAPQLAPQPQPSQSACQLTNGLLPAYIKPLHSRMAIEDVDHLWKKGALTIPDTPFRNALLTAYIEFADQLVAVPGGYVHGRCALYDFDYESDRVAIVQALLLMTYWYETPDDQKGSWHWMGVAISIAHTVGLHRNPSPTAMPPRKQKLWKRIWWSCFMRDRLDEDFDVPMLELEDFETNDLPPHILPSCNMLRDTALLSDLTHLCIAKAKLCLCISHVLSAQYSVLIRDQGQAMNQEDNTRSSMMLFPKKLDQTDEVRACDAELADWLLSLPMPCIYRSPIPTDLDNGQATLVVQRALLHMCYYATLSALHRPQ
ncbi:hypothetical protein VE04_09646, partial [Pseudogymnoascus sp. 24MN13]